MSIKDLIAAAYNKDATSFESAFQSIMQDKVAAAVESAFTAEAVEEELDEAKKSEKAEKEDEDEDEMCEDVDQIDELSQDTLHNYFAKAATSRKNARADAERGMNVTRPSGKTISKTTAALKTYRKRSAGLNAAAAKMEEVEQMDELSNKTLASYTNKAADSMANAAHSLGKKSERADEVDRMTNRHMPDKYTVRDNMKKALDADDKSQRKDREVIGKRITGIAQATKKLAK